MVTELGYPAHEAKYLKRQKDGQQEEYVTLPPDKRARSSLEGVRDAYLHKRCGTVTGMREEIIRSYLDSPWLYPPNATFCCGCGRYVPFRHGEWIQTGGDIQSYFNRLHAQKPGLKAWGCSTLVSALPLTRGLILVAAATGGWG